MNLGMTRAGHVPPICLGKNNEPTANARRSAIDMTHGPRISKTEAPRRAKRVKLIRVTCVIRVFRINAVATPPLSRIFKTSNSIRNRNRNGKHNHPPTSVTAMRVTTAHPINSRSGSKWEETRLHSNVAVLRHRKGSLSQETRLPRNTKHAAVARVLVTMMTTVSIMTTTARPWPNPAACAFPSA